MSSPRVSVCIPVYNGSAYIAESIESILAQTYEDFRLIVSDNCSTDNTGEIVLGFHDPRIRYVRNSENLGPVGNANRCLDLAGGEYVCIFHHDDLMLPENLERKVRLLDENPEVGFVHSNLVQIGPNGEVVAPNIWNKDSRRDYIEAGATLFQKFISGLPLGSSIFIGAVLARRVCYERVGGFSPRLRHCNDSEMWMRMSLFYNVACIGTPLVKYRLHSTSASSELGLGIEWLEEHYLAARIVLNELRDRISKWKDIRERVSANFANQALIRGREADWEGNFALSRSFLAFGVRVNPKLIQTKEFWRLAIRLALGPTGIQVYRKIRRGLRAER